MIPLAAVLTFLSALMIVSGVRSRRADPVEARLAAIRAGVRSQQSPLDRPFIDRAVVPTFSGLANALMRLLPSTWLEASSRRLVWAGSPTGLPGFVVIWVSQAAAFGLAFGFLAFSAGLSGPLALMAALGGVAVGSAAPQLWLSARISERQFQARKQLPDIIDLMTTSVEAGLSLDAALTRVAEYGSGPLQKEIGQALDDMTLGKSRRDALGEAAERLNLPELTTFIQTINHAEVTGAPIGQVLRVQAEQVRVKRRQMAEAQAQRAPLLMIIPLVFLIFPSLFIVLLGPAALTVIDLLKSTALY